MPALELKTNVKIDDPKPFLLEFSKFSAELLNKPELYISVSYSYNENLTFNGSLDPALLLTITSLGNINPEVNEKYSKALFEYFEKKLGVPDDRGYITFYDPGRAYIGHKSTTAAGLFGK
ncbi:hypothetical protein CERSUDRAFT_97643 [Gelatoporia subvermispora B]|uniref:L-dopachrome isomerase n=1 Tax=Ceriporiopsis subvermispora (strain B) TaxID=914234 RepID=M2QBL7_CERS8|nr:hypothetical protein CERSUDRAFT_97643 [Gelatoporia subvermispora B]